jgi:hypothetical protein
MDRYNRQLHQSEKDRLRELADGDEEKLGRLWAVACAKVECYAEFPEDSDLYIQYKAIADMAYGEGYQAEWDLLADQKYFVPYQSAQQMMFSSGYYESLFKYTPMDKAADSLALLDNTYHIGVKTGGAIQYVSGSFMVGISGGVALTTSELGVGLLAVGGMVYYWDQANAGYLTVVNAKFHETAFVEALQTKLGMSAEEAYILDALVSLTGGAGIVKNFNTVANAAKYTSTYNPIRSGPLPTNIANTFRSGTYVESVTHEPTILYRVYGGNAEEFGSYWTRTLPKGYLQSTIDSAIDPAWGNTANKVVKIEVPSGVKMYEGVAAPQGDWLEEGIKSFFHHVL